MKAGIYYNVPFSEYQKWECVNNSTLWQITKKSAMHAKEYIENPPEPSKAFVFGRGLHSFLLEPDKFFEEYIIAPKIDRRTKAGKEEYAQFEQESLGKDIITEADYVVYQIIAKQIKGNEAHKLIKNGKAEVCIVWEDPRTGLMCKARLDYVHPDWAIIVDVKSTTDASRDEFASSIYKYGYFQQCAFYSWGWNQLTGDEVDFNFLPCEKAAPYAVAAYRMPENVFIAGAKCYKKSLKIYKQCLESGIWKGYQDTVETLDMPQWAYNRLGIGQYDLQGKEIEDDNNKNKTGFVKDWNELESQARESESNPKAGSNTI